MIEIIDNWADCRLRGSSFISRFLGAGEQINAPTSTRSRPGSPWKRSRLRRADPRRTAFCDFGARVRFVEQSEKCESVCLAWNNIPQHYYRYVRLRHTVTPFIWANQTVFVELVISRCYSSTKIKRDHRTREPHFFLVVTWMCDNRSIFDRFRQIITSRVACTSAVADIMLLCVTLLIAAAIM